tara:strand:- start:209 stop:388 length:180 start_codon:yes stop_codon:yes gene_type:complete
VQRALAIAGDPVGILGVHGKSRFIRIELYEALIASSNPLLGFFFLLINQFSGDGQPRAF